jgi:hypothetical protein
MIISIVFDLEIWQYDAINVFINNEINEELYNECSNEFSRFDYCWKLNKASFDSLISKFDYDFERFRIAIDLKNTLLIRK